MSTDTRDKLNASETDYHEKFDRDAINRQFKDLTSTPDMKALDDQGNAIARDYNPETADQSRKALTGQENNADDQHKTAIGDTRTGQAAVAAATAAGSPIAGGVARALSKIRVNKTGGGAIAGIVIVIAMLVGASFLTASLGPIAFFTNILDDLNDQLPALDKRMSHMMRAKFTKSERAELLKGCTKMSIRCKMKSLSSRDIKRLNRAGITVEGDTLLKRTFPDKFLIQENGQTKSYNPSELADLMTSKEPSIAKARLRIAYNMRSIGFLDRGFSSVLRKFGLSKAAAKLTGNVDEDLAKLAKGESSFSTDNTITTGETEDGKPTVNGEPTTPKGSALAELIGTGAANGFKDGLKQFGKVFNITGYFDMLCTVRNMIGYSATAAKYAKGIKLAAYVMPIAAIVYKIKAGQGKPEDAEVIGKLFNSTDARATILDANESFKTYNESTKDITEKTMDNPYKGRSVMDGSLYKMSSISAPPRTTEATQKYSLGISLASLVGMLTFGTILFKAMGVSSTSCKLIQNWAARGLAFIVGILSWFIGVGEVITAHNLLMAAAVMASMVVIGGSLAVLTNQNPVPDDIEQKPEEVHAALWSGQAFLSGETAKARGLIPGTDEEILAYSRELKQTTLAYRELETNNTSWNDLSSPDSKLSRIASALQSVTQPSSQTGSGYLASMLSTATTALASPLRTTASASTIDPSRLKKCSVEETQEIDMQAHAALDGGPIALDVQCNVRYFMPQEDLALDTEEVAKYMEDNNYVERDPETGESITGLPVGYTLPPEDQQKNWAIGFLEGTVKGLVNQFYSTRNFGEGAGAEYGKYLDFCAYRSMPWGETFEESSGIGAAEADWVNGKNCMKKDYKTRAFRIYTLDKTLVDITEPGESTAGDNGGTDTAGPGMPPDAEPSGAGWKLKDGVDYSHYKCEMGTDTGTYTHPTKHITFRICMIDGKKVASVISGRVKGIKDLAQSLKGLNLTVNSGLRTYEEQEALYNANCHSGVCSPPTAVPGTSNHEGGTAIDWGTDGASWCFPRGSTCVGNPGYDFMVEHGKEQGFIKLPSEAWHWSMDGG